jgi:hypothetical protein
MLIIQQDYVLEYVHQYHHYLLEIQLVDVSLNVYQINMLIIIQEDVLKYAQ